MGLWRTIDGVVGDKLGEEEGEGVALKGRAGMMNVEADNSSKLV